MLIFLYIIFSSKNLTAADLCSTKACPQGKEPISICFSEPEYYSNLMTRTDVFTSCGYFTKIIIAKTTADISKALDELIADCKTIKELRFTGHGFEGNQVAGDLNYQTVQNLEKYACAFHRKAEIEYMGCNVGKGCVGDMLLYQTAKNLLSVSGGSVKAATTYSIGIPPILPTVSMNGKHRKLIYDPKKTPSDKWKMTGLAISDRGSINERCSNEMNELIEEFKAAKGEAIEKGCDLNYSPINRERLNEYKNLQRRLSLQPPYLQSADSEGWKSLVSSIDSLKYSIRLFEMCEAPINRPNKTKAEEGADGAK